MFLIIKLFFLEIPEIGPLPMLPTKSFQKGKITLNISC